MRDDGTLYQRFLRLWPSQPGPRAEYIYKLRQARTPVWPLVAADAAPAEGSYAEQIRSLAAEDGIEQAAFQSAAVAAFKLLNRAAAAEALMAQAAISLAQREKLRRLLCGLDGAREALRELLSDRGTRMLDLAAPAPPLPADSSWWFALTETLQVLEESAACMAAMMSGQPRGSTGRRLAGTVTRLLRHHYQQLLHEAEQWMN